MRLTRRAFRRLLQQALDQLPPQVMDALENVAIVVEERPTAEQLRRMKIAQPNGLLGLYEGVPRTERYGNNVLLPDKITLFQRPLESAATSSDELKRDLTTTLIHEIAHHVGWSDADLDCMGLG
ncbi:MAG: metallopeptidase family protein [Dehalococcoidia bacterium]|nr:metallopeptidase family protein [Dehalococcoidia bacterium]